MRVASGPFAKLPAKRVSFMTLTFSHIASGMICQPPPSRLWRTLRRSERGLGLRRLDRVCGLLRERISP